MLEEFLPLWCHFSAVFAIRGVELDEKALVTQGLLRGLIQNDFEDVLGSQLDRVF